MPKNRTQNKTKSKNRKSQQPQSAKQALWTGPAQSEKSDGLCITTESSVWREINNQKHSKEMFWFQTQTAKKKVKLLNCCRSLVSIGLLQLFPKPICKTKFPSAQARQKPCASPKEIKPSASLSWHKTLLSWKHPYVSISLLMDAKHVQTKVLLQNVVLSSS